MFLCASAWASEVPDNLGNVALGKKAPAKANLDGAIKITAYGLQGYASITAEKGLVRKIQFTSEFESENECKAGMVKVSAQIEKELGPGQKDKDGRLAWESAGRRLTLSRENEEGVDILRIYLEAVKENSPGEKADGFTEFWNSFKQALVEGKKDAAFAFFKVPFKDNYQEIYDKSKSLSFKDRAGFEGVYTKLFTEEAVKKLQAANPQFDKRSDGYIIDYAYSNFVCKKVGGKWLITEIAYQE